VKGVDTVFFTVIEEQGKVEKLREAKVRRVLLARSCAMEGEDVV
jgi:hypothetical protein